MYQLQSFLGGIVKHGALPLIAAAAAWYGGAKYGAPEIFVSTIDQLVEQGDGLIGGLLGEEEAAE